MVDFVNLYNNPNSDRTTTTANFTIAASISNIMVESTDLLQVGVNCFISDGTEFVYLTVTAINSPTDFNADKVSGSADALIVDSGATVQVVGPEGTAGFASPLTTKGDILTYDTGDTRLGVGTDGQVLTANSATSEGVEWTTPAATGVETQDDGVQVDPAATILNFTGVGVGVFNNGGGETEIEIPGGGNVELAFYSYYFKLDEVSGTRIEASGSGNDLTDNNTVGSTTGILGNGAQFVAANSESLSGLSFAGPDTNVDDSSISLWFNLASIPTDSTGIYVLASRGLNAERQFRLEYDSDNASRGIYYVIGDAGSNSEAILIVPKASITAGQWEHLVATHVKATKTLTGYLNGQEESSGTYTLTASDSFFEDFYLGASNWSGSPADFWDGGIDEFGLWTGTALTEDGIRALYAGGVGKSFDTFEEQISYSDGVVVETSPTNYSITDSSLTAHLTGIDNALVGGGGGGGGHSEDFGDGVATSFVITHNLGTKDVVVSAWDNTTPFDEVYPTVSHTSDNTVTLDFGATVPTTNQYRVFVTSGGGGSGGRTQQATNVTYYVRTDGNDSNTGLTNDSGGAFLTIQKGIDVATSLDILPGVIVTVDVQAGTFSGFTSKTIVGQGQVSVQGQGSGTTTINTAIIFDHFGHYLYGGFTLDGGGSINMVSCNNGITELVTEVDFLSANVHIVVTGASSVYRNNSDYSISGGAVIHLFVQVGSTYEGIGVPSKTVTLNSTPAFSSTFINSRGSFVDNNPTRATYSGAATGTRYIAEMNGVLNATTGGANYYPGNAAGITQTGGQYIG